jgi:tungstate transport system substrate-binding protein
MFSIRAFNNILIVFIAISITWYSNCFADNKQHKIIRLATTTSTDNSGLLRELLPHFSTQTGYQVHVIAVGTGKALRMGKDGDVDVVLVHAPAAEAAFIDAKYGLKRHQVMYNDFVMLGPASDPAGIKKAKSVTDALKRIAEHAAIFVSRGDDSGTHKKELALWQAGKVEPQGQWYRMAGQGMGKVIQMATEMNAYTLADRGTWLAYQDKSLLNVLFQGDPLLHNPYGIIAVNPQRYPDLNFNGAQALINWMTSAAGQRLIGNFKIAGFRLFTPAAVMTGAVSHSHQ